MSRLARLLTLFNTTESKAFILNNLRPNPTFRVPPRTFFRLNTPTFRLLHKPTSLFPPEHSTTTRNVSAENLDQKRKVLPEELLSNNVVVLSCESSAKSGICDVFVIGTCHVSKESCREVRDVISYLKPEVVFLELCSHRQSFLMPPRSLKVPTMREILHILKENRNVVGVLISLLTAKVAAVLEVHPGAEFHAAYEEVKKYGGKVILGDRPMQVTLQRTWAKLPLWHKTKLLSGLVFSTLFIPSAENLNKLVTSLSQTSKSRIDHDFVERVQETRKEVPTLEIKKSHDSDDMATLAIREMSKAFPTLKETLIDERDQYMSSLLHKAASKHSAIVAIVGKGHLEGIKRYWKKPVEMDNLMKMPS